jgi:hypothetical protein
MADQVAWRQMEDGEILCSPDEGLPIFFWTVANHNQNITESIKGE